MRAGSGVRGRTGSTVQPVEPQLRPVEPALCPAGLPARPGDADDVVGQPLSLGLLQSCLEMGSCEVFMQKM